MPRDLINYQCLVNHTPTGASKFFGKRESDPSERRHFPPQLIRKFLFIINFLYIGGETSFRINFLTASFSISCSSEKEKSSMIFKNPLIFFSVALIFENIIRRTWLKTSVCLKLSPPCLIISNYKSNLNDRMYNPSARKTKHTDTVKLCKNLDERLFRRAGQFIFGSQAAARLRKDHLGRTRVHKSVTLWIISKPNSSKVLLPQIQQ